MPFYEYIAKNKEWWKNLFRHLMKFNDMEEYYEVYVKKGEGVKNLVSMENEFL